MTSKQSDKTTLCQLCRKTFRSCMQNIIQQSSA